MKITVEIETMQFEFNNSLSNWLTFTANIYKTRF